MSTASAECRGECVRHRSGGGRGLLQSATLAVWPPTLPAIPTAHAHVDLLCRRRLLLMAQILSHMSLRQDSERCKARLGI